MNIDHIAEFERLRSRAPDPTNEKPPAATEGFSKGKPEQAAESVAPPSGGFNGAHLAPLLERVERGHCWSVDVKLPRDRATQHRKSPLTDQAVALHLAGGPRRGVCPIPRGESTTRVALLDFDSHRGEASWSEMQDAASIIASELEQRGLAPVAFRSSGGNGIHLYLLWDQPQDARAVRQLLTSVLAVQSFKSGTKGMKAGEVEIFPKQDSVPADGCGSMFVLPLAGNSKSVPLDGIAFEPTHEPNWQISAPVPVVAAAESSPAPRQEETTPDALPAESEQPSALRLSDERIREILAARAPDDYEEWLKGGMALHHAFKGDVHGLHLWDEWSQGSSKYAGFEDLSRRWSGFGRGGAAPVTFASLRVDKPAGVEEFSAIPDEESAAVVKSARFTPVHSFDFKSTHRAASIVKGVLPRAELVVAYGPSGSGKTFAILDLVAHVAQGLAWRGRRTFQGTVVYICAEDAGGVALRLEAYVGENGVARDRFPLYVIADLPNFLKGEDAIAIAKALIPLRPSLVVVDTLSAVTPGADENSGEDMGNAIRHCKGIHKATGATVLLVHHSGKDAAKGARGWSGLRAAADAELEFGREGTHRWLSVTKQKNAVDGGRYDFKLKMVNLGTDEDGDTIDSCVIEPLDGPPAPEPVSEEILAEGKQAVLAALSMFTKREEATSAKSRATTFLPRMMESENLLAGLTKKIVAEALDALLESGALERQALLPWTSDNRHKVYGLALKAPI